MVAGLSELACVLPDENQEDHIMDRLVLRDPGFPKPISWLVWCLSCHFAHHLKAEGVETVDKCSGFRVVYRKSLLVR